LNVEVVFNDENARRFDEDDEAGDEGSAVGLIDRGRNDERRSTGGSTDAAAVVSLVSEETFTFFFFCG
jgi:hypothetical protein